MKCSKWTRIYSPWSTSRKLAISGQMEGRVDISFNALGISDPKILGTPLVDMDVEQFCLPIATWATSYFLTARLAARRMVVSKSGVIMTVTTPHSRAGFPLAGAYGPAMAAKEALTRELSSELAPHGIRVVGLRPNAIPEAKTTGEAFAARATALGVTPEQFLEVLANRDAPAPAHDARGGGEYGGLHGVRQGERNDEDDRQPDDGQSR